MLKLVPFEQTAAGRGYIQEGQISTLSEMIEQKFSVPATEISDQLVQLTVEDLKALSRFFLKANSFEQIEAWTKGRLAITE